MSERPVRNAGALTELAQLVELASLTDYGPVQLAGFLGMQRWQLDRALSSGLIPAPDRGRGRWSAAVAGELAPRAAEIIAAVGSIPDLGAGRAAELLSARLGVRVTGAGIAELARGGHLAVAGHYKGWPVYDGQVLEAFARAGGVGSAVAEANRAGELRTADQSAEYLRIRRADLNHLTRAGLLSPAEWGHGPYDNRSTFSVPLYRTGDLDALLNRPDIDWNAVRAVRPGHRSPLAALSAEDPAADTGKAAEK